MPLPIDSQRLRELPDSLRRALHEAMPRPREQPTSRYFALQRYAASLVVSAAFQRNELRRQADAHRQIAIEMGEGDPLEGFLLPPTETSAEPGGFEELSNE